MQAELKPAFEPLDPKNKETWRNIPAPAYDPRVDEELRHVGGVVPPGFGEMSGKPQFKLVWGQKHRMFQNGRERLAFDDSRIPARVVRHHYAVTDPVFRRAVEWYKAESVKRAQVFGFDFFDTGRERLGQIKNLPDFRVYLEGRESSLDYMKLPEDASPEKIAHLLPNGWKYLAGLSEYREIGEQCFYLLQWLPPQMIDSEERWNLLRFGWGWSPETETEEYLDLIGPYPRHGDYVHTVLKIAERLPDDGYAYRQPTLETVITPLKELLVIRDRLSNAEKTREGQEKRRFDRQTEKDEKRREKGEIEFDKRFDDARWYGPERVSLAGLDVPPKSDKTE